MLRSVEDEVRAHGAEAIQRFVVDNPATQRNPRPPPRSSFGRQLSRFSQMFGLLSAL